MEKLFEYNKKIVIDFPIKGEYDVEIESTAFQCHKKIKIEKINIKTKQFLFFGQRHLTTNQSTN